MNPDVSRHQDEIQRNRAAWESKPLLRRVYAGFYERIRQHLNTSLPGAVVEIGSGIGNLKAAYPLAIATDLFANPWLDLVCDGYMLPFREAAVSHLVLFDVFHHLAAPVAFLGEARRVLRPQGRLILFEPFVSWTSLPIYGLFHHEPLGLKRPIDFSVRAPQPRSYYAAQGNATRLFFRRELGQINEPWNSEWSCLHLEAFSCFEYLLSGGYSKPALYPQRCAGVLSKLDAVLSRWPRLFAGRCIVVLEKRAA